MSWGSRLIGIGHPSSESREQPVGACSIIAFALGATRYLSGPAGRSYLDEAQFAAAGITLEYLAPSSIPATHRSTTSSLRTSRSWT